MRRIWLDGDVMRLGIGLAVLLLASCAATDEPYVPNNSSSPSTEGPVIVDTGPTNKEIFERIEQAERIVDGRAVAVMMRLNSYVVTVVTEDEVYEVTLVGSGVITNKIADHDESVDEQTKPQVVTLADAIDAAAVANPGRVDEATISPRDGKAVYVVRIENENGMSTLYVDALSAELLGSEVLEDDEDPE